MFPDSAGRGYAGIRGRAGICASCGNVPGLVCGHIRLTSGSLASAISPDKSAVPPAFVSANTLQPLLATVIDITSINTNIRSDYEESVVFDLFIAMDCGDEKRLGNPARIQ